MCSPPLDIHKDDIVPAGRAGGETLKEDGAPKIAEMLEDDECLLIRSIGGDVVLLAGAGAHLAWPRPLASRDKFGRLNAADLKGH